MYLMQTLILVMQCVILKQIVCSTIWRCDRVTIDCIKVSYCFIALACILSIGFLTSSMFFDAFGSVSVLFMMMMLSFMTIYSLIMHQIVFIFNKRRVNQRVTPYVMARSGNAKTAG